MKRFFIQLRDRRGVFFSETIIVPGTSSMRKAVNVAFGMAAGMGLKPRGRASFKAKELPGTSVPLRNPVLPAGFKLAA